VTIVAAWTPASYALGWLIGVPILVPFLNAAVPWVLMVQRLRRGEVRRAIALMLIWAALMAVTATAMAALGWSKTRDGGDLFLRSWYRDGMLHWVRTGDGAESRPSEFVPAHLGHAALFTVTAAITGGALAMPMGAALINQMSDYVGALAAAGPHPIAVALLGWHPWAVLRVIAFVILGVLLSARVGVRLFDRSAPPVRLADYSTWTIAAVLMLAGDLVLKWALAPIWSQLLRGLVGW
jgi:hypothetical protein